MEDENGQAENKWLDTLDFEIEQHKVGKDRYHQF